MGQDYSWVASPSASCNPDVISSCWHGRRMNIPLRLQIARTAKPSTFEMAAALGAPLPQLIKKSNTKQARACLNALKICEAETLAVAY